MMDPSSSFDPKVLMSKGKRATASYIHSDCFNNPCPKHLNAVLDCLLNPLKAIDEWDTIDWCKWLIAGGRTPDEFATIVRAYDNATTCGLVWTPNFVAYRCRTCGISPCMSLCTECFKKGNHHRHDFNMFLSQAGGACDCGDTSVMKETGFCDRHGPDKGANKINAPNDLMAVAEAMMPRIIFRLILHLRENCNAIISKEKSPVQDADAFITMLLDFNNMGGVMRRVMTSALTNPQKYRVLNEVPENCDSELVQYIIESKRIYEEALELLPNPVLTQFNICTGPLKEYLAHKSFLEELVFWTVKYEFPQRVVCLLLNMLPDPDYKEALTRAFVLHYSRISLMLERSNDPDTLSNRVVHVSVQLFSNERLALKMTNEMNLLHVMVISLKLMMIKIVKQNTLHDSFKNVHNVVDCASSVMKEHCYWPLVSDLNNVLSHRPVALQFMSDDVLLEIWFSFLNMFQGMNVNEREMKTHVEFEPNTYYAAFSAELEASAYPMWALVSHLTDSSTVDLTKKILTICLNEIKKFLNDINFNGPNENDHLQVSFHLPLHRYFSVFLCQAIAKQGLTLNDILPSNDALWLMMMHPLRVQVAFYEILNSLWVRNGLQIKGQAMTYIQCNFCNSMVDADLYLLQICCTRCCSNDFLNILIDKFHIKEWMSLSTGPDGHLQKNSYLEQEHDTAMLESFLIFLTTLISIRTNIGLNDRDLNRLEMITLLCMSDKTHSQLMELMPERCGTSQSRDFETLLSEVADYRPPAPLESSSGSSGNLQQGMYSPKSQIWENYYDPIHVLLRAVHRKDFQTSMDRYTDYIKHNKLNKFNNNKTNNSTNSPPWPPFREPSECNKVYDDPRLILNSRVFHASAFIILYKAIRGTVSEQIMALIIFLLNQAVAISLKNEQNNEIIQEQNQQQQVNDMDLENWFKTDSLFENLTTNINKIILTPEPEVSPEIYSSDSDLEWEISEAMDTQMNDNENILMLQDEPTTSSSNNDLIMFNENNSPPFDGGDENLPILPNNSVLALPSSTFQQMEIDDLMTVAVVPNIDDDDDDDDDDNSSTSISDYISSRSEQSELPSPPQLPALIAGNEIGRRRRNAVDWDENLPGTSTTTDLVPSTSTSGRHYHRKTYNYHHRRNRRNTTSTRSNNSQELNPPPPTLKLNESIISLLLKLHSQLSGIPDSYNSDDYINVNDNNNLIGDGPFFIGKLLKRIEQADNNCKQFINETRLKLWPTQKERDEAKKLRENRERDERRKRAKERQQKLMAEFATKQKQFMERTKMMETDDDDNSNNTTNQSESNIESGGDNNSSGTGIGGDDILINKQEYDCVICSQSTPSTEDKPMGLVVLIQATSVIGHRRRFGQPERSILPTNDYEKYLLRRDDTLSSEFDRRLDELDRHFEPKSWYLSVNLGWDGGVHVQTCGHHLHLDCLNSYLQSLRSQQRQLHVAEIKGEYLCPLCRQLANSFLPLVPQLGECSQIVQSKTNTNFLITSKLLNELNEFLKENDQKPSNTNMAEAIGKIMEVMTSSTQLKPMFRLKTINGIIDNKPIPQSLFLFVTSIARTNLEVELIQRGGNLVQSTQTNQNSLLPKRDCIVPLLHVLSVHARVARVLSMWPAWMIFQQLCGLPPNSPSLNQALVTIENEMPLLLKDPIALLLQFILLLPLNFDQIYFTTTVQMVYNLLYYQVVAQISCGLTTSERMKAIQFTNQNNEIQTIRNFCDALALINQCLGHTDLYMEDGTTTTINDENQTTNTIDINIVALEQQIQKLCLPFLRIAALLKFHLYRQPLSEIHSPQTEFVRLVYYLDLVTERMDWSDFNAACALNWPLDDTNMSIQSPTSWLNQYGLFVNKSQIAARSLLVDQHITWHPPRLLQLPREYEKIFTYYHERPCSQCHSVPQETSICLLCGTIVCLKQSCCKQLNICEATAHALECGAGTGVFLVVTTTYIIVIRGHRACLWGSLYLDEFEEEDRDLKRGKPLYLSKDRYQMLEQQWLAHRFDHTKKSWVPHRNGL